MVKKGYKQTELGVIPEKWTVSTIGAIADVKTGPFGSALHANDYVQDGTPIITVEHLGETGLTRQNLPKVSAEDRRRLSAYSMQEGDIVFSRVGSVDRNAYVTAAENGWLFSGRILRLRAKSEELSTRYLGYYFKAEETKERVRGVAVGQTMASLNTKLMNAFKVVLPTVEEQKNIAALLSNMDTLISALEKQISKKKAIKQGAMLELLTGKRRLPGFFGEWQSFEFGYLFDFIPNNAFTRAQMDVSGRVKNIHYGDILTKYGAYISADSKDIPYIAKEIDLSRFSEKCYLQSGDLVIADTAEDETVGKALEVINVECPVLAGQHTLLCRPKVRFAEKFLGYYLNAACYHDQMLPYIVGTKVSSVSKASIAQTKLVVPKYEEQQAISYILADMDDEITELEQKLAKYRQVKQGMMQRLLTGKIRLKNDVVDSVHTEQKVSAKKSPVSSAHNHLFDDAVAIAAIVDAFYSDKYPLGRVKAQKLLYLLHRHQGVSVSDFKKKAAGPYADTVRYKGGEPIAKKNKYIVSESGRQGTRYSKGTNMGQALDYVERWGMQADLQWLKENFLHTSRNDLELFATVDMAMCDLDEVGISVSVESIKNLIASNKEWKAKLSKTYFSDWDIARAIKKCTELFN